MGEFDDVMALGPGDDWDEWDQWAEAADEQRSALLTAPRVRLEVAGVTVEFRGDFDEELLAAFDHLSVLTVGVVDGAVRLKVTHESAEPSAHDRTGALVLTGPDHEQLLRVEAGDDPGPALCDLLQGIVVADWPNRLALAAGCVELDTADGPVGVVMVADDPDQLAAVVAELLLAGAALVGAERVVFRPGTRTVTALAVPVAPRIPVAGASIRTVPQSTVDVVVHLRSDPSSSVWAMQLDPVHALERWSQILVDSEHAGAITAAIAASTLSGADVWEMVQATPAQAAQFVAGLKGPARRRLITVDTVPGSAEPSARLVRVHPGPDARGEADSGGVVIDPVARTVDRIVAADLPGGAGGLTRWALDQSAATGASALDPSAEAVSVLATVMDLLLTSGTNDDLPVVVGDMLLAHDALFPEWLFSGDRVDLLVEPEHLEILREQLPAAGFSAPSPSDTLRDPTDGRVELWRSPGGAVAVALHRQLAAGPFGELVDHDELVSRAAPVRIGDRWYAGLHPEDRFVHAAALAAATPSGPGYQDLLRSVAISAPDDPELAASAMEAAERWGAIRGVLAAVRSTEQAFGGLDPWLVERAARDDSSRRGGRRRNR